MCLELGGNLYKIQTFPPGFLSSFTGVLDDCWVFRKGDCAGEILMEHKVIGTRLLTIGCTEDVIAMNAVPLDRSVPLDCGLTNPPKLVDVFKASAEYVPSELQERLSDNNFKDLNMPMAFVNKTELLKTIYAICYQHARHGVAIDTVFHIFKHTRAVLWHTQNCHSELVGTLIGFPQAYLALYGSAFASLTAMHVQDGTWRNHLTPLTGAHLDAYHSLLEYAVSIPVSQTLSDDALPSFVPMARIEMPEVAATQRQLVRPSALQGQAYCDDGAPGMWIYRKVTNSNETDTDIDCCAMGCFKFEDAAHIPLSSFMTGCCFRCNKGKCRGKMSARDEAVMELAEITLPLASTRTMNPAVTVMI